MWEAQVDDSDVARPGIGNTGRKHVSGSIDAELNLGKRRGGRPLKDIAIRIEDRTMAWTVHPVRCGIVGARAANVGTEKAQCQH